MESSELLDVDGESEIKLIWQCGFTATVGKEWLSKWVVVPQPNTVKNSWFERPIKYYGEMGKWKFPLWDWEWLAGRRAVRRVLFITCNLLWLIVPLTLGKGAVSGKKKKHKWNMGQWTLPRNEFWFKSFHIESFIITLGSQKLVMKLHLYRFMVPVCFKGWNERENK